MEKVNVKRSDLAKVLGRNRDRHVAQFEAAKIAFRKKLMDILKRALAKARKGKKVVLPIHLPVPVSYEKEYDRALGMLKMSSDSTVALTEEDYRQFVEDAWDWKHDFLANTVSYSKKRMR